MMRRQLEPLWLTRLILMMFISVPVGRGSIRRVIFEAIWRRVWLKSGYTTRNELTRIVEHYAILRPWSIDTILTILLIPIGTIRIAKRNPSISLPIEKDFKIKQVWSEKDFVVEVTLFTILPWFRTKLRGLPFIALTRYAYRKSN